MFKCPVCGKPGSLQKRGDSWRVLHYSYIDGARVFTQCLLTEMVTGKPKKAAESRKRRGNHGNRKTLINPLSAKNARKMSLYQHLMQFMQEPKKRSIGKMKVDKSVSVTIMDGNRETYISPLLPKAPLKMPLYHHTQNTQKMTKIEIHKSGFIHQNILGAGSSAWYERLTCTQEVGGSNPPRSTKFFNRILYIIAIS